VSDSIIFIFGLVITLVWSAMLGMLFLGIDKDTEAEKSES